LSDDDDIDLDDIKAILESNRELLDAIHLLELLTSRGFNRLEAKLEALDADLGRRLGQAIAQAPEERGGLESSLTIEGVNRAARDKVVEAKSDE
jgi:hypothetical protein